MLRISHALSPLSVGVPVVEDQVVVMGTHRPVFCYSLIFPKLLERRSLKKGNVCDRTKAVSDVFRIVSEIGF